MDRSGSEPRYRRALRERSAGSGADMERLQRHANYIQIAIFVAACVAAGAALIAWNSELDKRRTEATLKFFEPLIQKDYVRALWRLQTFTLCFEKNEKAHLAYMSPTEVMAPQSLTANKRLARKWWQLVENPKIEEPCRKVGYGENPDEDDLQLQMFLVYARLAQLGACLEAGLCSQQVADQMSDAADFFTALALTNYLRFSTEVSREWQSSDGPVVRLLDKYFLPQAAFTKEKRPQIWNDAPMPEPAVERTK